MPFTPEEAQECGKLYRQQEQEHAEHVIDQRSELICEVIDRELAVAYGRRGNIDDESGTEISVKIVLTSELNNLALFSLPTTIETDTEKNRKPHPIVVRWYEDALAHAIVERVTYIYKNAGWLVTVIKSPHYELIFCPDPSPLKRLAAQAEDTVQQKNMSKKSKKRKPTPAST